MNTVNLIPRQRRQQQQRRRHTQAWVGFLRVYGICLTIASCLIMLPAHASSPSLDLTLARLDKRIESSIASFGDLKKQAADLDRALAASRACSDHPDWSLVLDAVARERSTDVTLESCDLTTARVEDKPAKVAPADKASRITFRDVHTIRLSGFSSSPAAAFEFARRLEKLGFADSVAVKDTRSLSLGAPAKLHTTHFDIEITISSAPALAAPDKEGAAK